MIPTPEPANCRDLPHLLRPFWHFAGGVSLMRRPGCIRVAACCDELKMFCRPVLRLSPLRHAVAELWFLF